MNSILLKNGIIYDGTGKKGFQADLLIEGDRIAKIGRDLTEAETVIDVSGKVVCPGFIDIHRHCDAKPLLNCDFGRRELTQGITTAVIGNCGISLVPAPSDDMIARELYDFNEAVLGPVTLDFPRSFEEYVERLKKVPLPVNMGVMIGTGSVRVSVKGFTDQPFTRRELEQGRQLIEDALIRGALGASVGIMYLPECYTSIEEFVYLLEPLGRYHRILTAHIRGEGDSLLESVAEVIEIARRVGCALEISHFKSCGMANWRKKIKEAILLIDNARKLGQDITCDFYPYEGGSTSLTTMLPPVFVRGNMTDALRRLGTREGEEEFRKSSRIPYRDWDNYCITLGWDRIIISGVIKEKYQKMRGMTMTAAASQFGYADPEALAAEMMYEENGKTAIINMSMCQDDIDEIARLPYSGIISDAIYAETDTPHPRMFGAFPKIIREYVNERKILSLETAIYKMTGLPAKRMQIEDRGVLQEGFYADILVFDPDKFRDNANFGNPAVLSSGITCLFLNGKMVIRDDEWKDEIHNGVCILK